MPLMRPAQAENHAGVILSLCRKRIRPVCTAIDEPDKKGEDKY